jgi:voltage-gated potassium channel Kch
MSDGTGPSNYILDAPTEKAAAKIQNMVKMYLVRRHMNCGHHGERQIFHAEPATLRAKLFRVLNDPSSSTAAFFVEVFWVLLITASLTASVVGTMKPFLGPDGMPGSCPLHAEYWTLDFVGTETAIVVACDPDTSRDCHSCPFIKARWFEAIDIACGISFSLDYIIRLAACPAGKRLDQVRSFRSFIDVVSFLPFYLQLALAIDPRNGNTEFVRGIRLLRVVRLAGAFNVAIERSLQAITMSSDEGRSPGDLMQIFSITWRRTKPSIMIALGIAMLASIMFGALMYTFEHGEWHAERKEWLREDGKPTPFTSIPAAIYWYVVTVTTCGYGDIVPITSAGKSIASASILSGMLILASPIATLSANFAQAEKQKREALVLEDLRREKLLRKANGEGTGDSDDDDDIYGIEAMQGGDLGSEEEDGDDDGDEDEDEYKVAGPQSKQLRAKLARKSQERRMQSFVGYLVQLRTWQQTVEQLVEVTDRMGTAISVSFDELDVIGEKRPREPARGVTSPLPTRPADAMPRPPTLLHDSNEGIRSSPTQISRLRNMGFDVSSVAGSSTPGMPRAGDDPEVKVRRRSADPIAVLAHVKLLKSGKYSAEHLQATARRASVPDITPPRARNLRIESV